MENNNDKWQEQQAPLKNHDDAFVEVGHDGKPVFPVENDKRDDSKEEQVKPSTASTPEK